MATRFAPVGIDQHRFGEFLVGSDDFDVLGRALARTQAAFINLQPA